MANLKLPLIQIISRKLNHNCKKRGNDVKHQYPMSQGRTLFVGNKVRRQTQQTMPSSCLRYNTERLLSWVLCRARRCRSTTAVCGELSHHTAQLCAWIWNEASPLIYSVSPFGENTLQNQHSLIFMRAFKRTDSHGKGSSCVVAGRCPESYALKSNCQSTGWNCSFSTGRQDRRGRLGWRDGGRGEGDSE